MKKMKKILVIAVLMIASLNVMNAQTINFGVKAGLNLADVSGSPSASSSIGGETSSYSNGMHIGFHIGAVCNIALNDNFSIAPELLYSQGGYKQTYTFTDDGSFSGVKETNTTVSNVSLNYLQIPIMAHYKLESGLYFEAGLYFGILLSASNHETGTFNETSPVAFNASSDTTSSNDSALNKVDFGLAFGVGYQLPMGLAFNVRYDLGLTSLVKSQTYGTAPYTVTEPAWGKNGIIQISISYMFGMAK